MIPHYKPERPRGQCKAGAAAGERFSPFFFFGRIFCGGAAKNRAIRSNLVARQAGNKYFRFYPLRGNARSFAGALYSVEIMPYISGYTRYRSRSLLHRCTSLLHRSTSLLHRCTSLRYRSTSLLHRCTSLRYRSTSLLYRSTSLLYRCTSLLHRCTSLLHRCTSLRHRYGSLRCRVSAAREKIRE
jgi:hypothetical protein